MSSGTLTLVNGSDAIVGVGTSFTADLGVGDYIFCKVNGTPYTMPVKTVTTGTGVIVTANYTGPDASGIPWTSVPQDIMSFIGAALGIQSAEALRQLNNDKDNWLQVYTATDKEITVRIGNGLTFTGPSWKHIKDLLATLDQPTLEALATQIQDDATQVASDKTSAATSAQTATDKATTATTQADRAKTEADRAQSANPDNQLKKANNLSDVADKAAARTNLQVVYRSPTTLTATDNLNDFNGLKAGEYFNSQNVNAKPENNYPVSSAGSLKVYWTSASNNTGCVQEYRVYSSSRMFSRIFNGVNWTPWVEYYNSGSVVPVANGGTGRSDGVLEAKPASPIADCVMLSPQGNQNAWIAIKDRAGVIRWRIGRVSANGSFQFIGYAADGSTTGAAGAVLEIDNTTGEIKSTKAITTSGIITGSMLTVSGVVYPNMRFLPLYTDSTVIPDTVVGGLTFFELSQDKANTTSSLGLIRRSKTGGRTGQIIVSFPSTAGTIALQGTSGIEYKRDVTDADYSDAIARIDSLRMVNFVYNDDEQNRVRFGVIAEEAELTAPQYIKHNQEQYEDILDENGEKVGAKYRDRPSVDVNPIVMDLLGYVKDLRKEIDVLKDELKELKEE